MFSRIDHGYVAKSNVLGFLLVKMLGKVVDAVAQHFEGNEEFVTLQGTMLQYDAFKRIIEVGQVSKEISTQMTEDCSICLEPVLSESDACRTKCNHTFHLMCLAQHLWSKAANRSCPLCRAPFQRVLACGRETEVIDILHKLSGNMDAVEERYRRFIMTMRQRTILLKNLKGASLSCLDESSRWARTEAMRVEAEKLCRMVRISEFYLLVNRMGYDDLLTKLDSKYGTRLASSTFTRTGTRNGAASSQHLQDKNHIDALLTDLEELTGSPQRLHVPQSELCDPAPQRLGHRPTFRSSLTSTSALSIPAPAGCAVMCIFVCRSNSARSIAAECVARARLQGMVVGGGADPAPVHFLSAATSTCAPSIKAGLWAALVRAGYSPAGLEPKSIERLLDTEQPSRAVLCFVALASDAEADLRRDPALAAAMTARQLPAALVVSAPIPAPTRADVTAEEAASLYDGLVRDVEAMVAGLPAVLGGAWREAVASRWRCDIASATSPMSRVAFLQWAHE